VKVTRHAFERSRERIKLSQKATLRLSHIAYNKGIGLLDATGSLFLYMTYLQHQGGAEIRIFAEKVWVFRGGNLLTVYQLPNEYRAVAKKLLARKKDRDEKERNARGYDPGSDEADSLLRQVRDELPAGDAARPQDLASPGIQTADPIQTPERDELPGLPALETAAPAFPKKS
jgi:hypothetical protein